MTPIQEKLLCLLEEIDEICRKNGIVYYLDGGSAIGALRHSGFIPWDDDIDIVFTRENWNKFLKATENGLPENRRIASLQNTPHYSMVYARYCDTQSTNILITSLLDVFESGVFIDMFILDPAPNDPEKRIEFMKVERGYCEFLNPYYYDFTNGANEWYDFFCKMAEEKGGRDAVIRWMEEHYFNLEEEDHKFYLFRYDLEQFLYDVTFFGTPRRVPFEGKLFPVPGRTEDYLRTHYGFEWFMIPPQKEQTGHDVVINLDVPYRKYLNDYMQYINYDEVLMTYTELHRIRVEAKKLSNSVNHMNCEISERSCKKYYDSQLANGVDPLKMLAQGNVCDVKTFCSGYIARQTDKTFINSYRIVDVDERVIAASLRVLEAEGNHKLAYKICHVRHIFGAEAKTEELKAAQQFVEDIMELIRGQEQGDDDIIRAQYEKLREFPDLIYVKQAAFWLRIRAWSAQQDPFLEQELLDSMANSAEEGYKMLIAELYLKQDRVDEALEIYHSLEDSRNGMIHQHIKAKTELLCRERGTEKQ